MSKENPILMMFETDNGEEEKNVYIDHWEIIGEEDRKELGDQFDEVGTVTLDIEGYRKETFSIWGNEDKEEDYVCIPEYIGDEVEYDDEVQVSLFSDLLDIGGR